MTKTYRVAEIPVEATGKDVMQLGQHLMETVRAGSDVSKPVGMARRGGLMLDSLNSAATTAKCTLAIKRALSKPMALRTSGNGVHAVTAVVGQASEVPL